jgi:hypothetical protein
MISFSISWDHLSTPQSYAGTSLLLEDWDIHGRRFSSLPNDQPGAATFTFWQECCTLRNDQATALTLALLAHHGGSSPLGPRPISDLFYGSNAHHLLQGLHTPDALALIATLPTHAFQVSWGMDQDTAGTLHFGDTIVGQGMLEGTWTPDTFFLPRNTLPRVCPTLWQDAFAINGTCLALGLLVGWMRQDNHPISFHSQPPVALQDRLADAIDATLHRGVDHGMTPSTTRTKALHGGTHSTLARGLRLRTRLASPGLRKTLSADLADLLMRPCASHPLIVPNRSLSPDGWIPNPTFNLTSVIQRMGGDALYEAGLTLSQRVAVTCSDSALRLALSPLLDSLHTPSAAS